MGFSLSYRPCAACLVGEGLLWSITVLHSWLHPVMAGATPAVSLLPIIGFPPPHPLRRQRQESARAVGGPAIERYLGG